MTDSVLLTQTARGVATLTFNRPEVHNAFDDELIRNLTRKLEDLDTDKDVRVIVLTGAGKSFSAGADVNWMRSQIDNSEAQNIEDASRLAQLMDTLDGMTKPTVARVNGPAFGGGVGLIACCDIAVATEEARFTLTEVRLGLVPAVISPYVIAAIGPRHARRYFQTSDALDAAAALNAGLVHIVCEADELDAVVAREIDNLLKGGPQALLECKDLIAEVLAGAGDIDALKQSTVRRIARLRTSPEGQEGLSAFLEKRKPKW